MLQFIDSSLNLVEPDPIPPPLWLATQYSLLFFFSAHPDLSEVEENNEASAKNEQANPVALAEKKETRVPSDSENALKNASQ